MRALIVSDVHVNLENLESVFKDAKNQRGFDEIWSLGGLVGYSPDPSACIAILCRNEIRTVAGKHDLVAESLDHYDATASVRWTTEQISAEEDEWMTNLPLWIEVDRLYNGPRQPSRPRF